MALCLCFYKILYTGHLQSVTRVHARRDARVRDQQHGRAVRGQRPMREKRTFFGAFLAFTKKVPAGRRTAEALDLDLMNRRTHDRRHPHPDPLPPAGEGEKQKLDSS